MSILQLTRWMQQALSSTHPTFIQQIHSAGPALASLLPVDGSRCSGIVQALTSNDPQTFVSGIQGFKGILDEGNPALMGHIDSSLRGNEDLRARMSQDFRSFSRLVTGEASPRREDPKHIVLNNQADEHRLRGDYARAAELFEAALRAGIDTLGRDHLHVATILNNLGETYRCLEEYARAEGFFLRALELRQKIRGIAHEETVATSNNLANLYREMNRFPEAIDLFQDTLRIAERHLGRMHPYIGTLLNNTAALHFAMGRSDRAEFDFNRAIAIYKTYGPRNPSLARAWVNLAKLHLANEKPDRAEPLLKKALAILKDELGPDHPEVKAAADLLEASTLLREVGWV